MLTIFSEDHRLRSASTELYGGELVAPFECPERMEQILARLGEVSLGEIRAPSDFGLDPVRRIHTADYIEFLRSCWADWQEAGFRGEAIASCWPARRMQIRPPRDIDGRIGYYAMAAETSISAGTWEAASASANVALTAQNAIADGAGSAFALCRPPGHHAASDLFGGYCFLNNAAIATQAFIDNGAGRVAILDIDFHHGNGTQDIFYQRGDVLFVSLHGEPENAFPYFLGYADETGAGEGEGANLNMPMAPGTGFEAWGACLDQACRRVESFGPDAVVVSLGADTFKDDPISFFKLESDDFKRIGARIAALGRPTLFVMEGGYAVSALGVNTVNVLAAFEDATS